MSGASLKKGSELQKVILLDVFEVLVGAVLQFVGGIFVTDDDGMGMLLEATDSPHVVDGLFDAMAEGTGLVVAIHHNQHFLGIHHCAYTNGQSCLRHQVDIVVEETTIGDDGIGSEGLLAGAALQAGAWLVEGNVAIRANATHEQVDAACGFNGFLVVLALFLQILGIAVKDMDILFLNVDVAEEVVPHKAMVALGMIFGEVHVLIHVERNDVLERYLASLVQGYQLSVHT